jgi:hypothetical protein
MLNAGFSMPRSKSLRQKQNETRQSTAEQRDDCSKFEAKNRDSGADGENQRSDMAI